MSCNTLNVNIRVPDLFKTKHATKSKCGGSPRCCAAWWDCVRTAATSCVAHSAAQVAAAFAVGWPSTSRSRSGAGAVVRPSGWKEVSKEHWRRRRRVIFLHPFAVLGATLCFINQCCKACEVFGFNEPPKWRILSSWYWRGFTCGGDWVPSLPGQLLPRDLKRKGRCHGRHDFKKNGVHSGWIQNQTLAHPITAPGLVPIAATCRLLGLERSLLRTCWVPQWRENEKAAGFCRDCRAYVFIRKMCAKHCRACFDVSTCSHHFMKSFFIIRSWSSDISSRQDVCDQGFSYQISADDVMKLQILVPSKSWPILTQNAADPDLSWAAERTWSELLQYLIAKVEVKLRDAFRLTSQHFRPAFGLVRLDPAWRFYIQLDALDQIAGESITEFPLLHLHMCVLSLFDIIGKDYWWRGARSNARLHCEKEWRPTRYWIYMMFLQLYVCFVGGTLCYVRLFVDDDCPAISAYFYLLLAFSMCILLYCHIMFMIHEYVQFVFSPSASFVSPFASFVQAASHHFGVFSWCIPPGFHRFPMGFPGHLLLHLLWIAPVVCYGRLKLGRGIGKMGTRTRTRVG